MTLNPDTGCTLLGDDSGTLYIQVKKSTTLLHSLIPLSMTITS